MVKLNKLHIEEAENECHCVGIVFQYYKFFLKLVSRIGEGGTLPGSP